MLLRSPAPLARLVIGADANAKSSLWNSPCQNSRGCELETLLASFPLHVANVPVASLAFTPPETQFIDITLVGNSVPIQNWRFPDIPSLSDHPYIYFELASSTPKIAKANKIFNVLPPLMNIDKKKFLTLLRASCAKLQSSDPRPDSASPASIDEAVHLLVNLISRSALSSKLPKIVSTSGRMPWWNDNLVRLRNATRKARKRWTASPLPDKARLRLSYQQSKSLYQRTLRQAIEIEWANFCANISDSDVLDSLKRLSSGTYSSPLPVQIMVNGQFHSDPAEISKHLALHFFPPPVQSATLSPSSSMNVSFYNRTDFPPISDVELADAIASLSHSASPGPDGISAELLCLSSQLISPLLLSTLNDALLCSYFPTDWRHAKVKVIAKPNKDNYTIPSNFRPISIVSTLSKVLEKIILARVSWVAKVNSWFSDRQHGFREGMSTESATHQLSWVPSGPATILALTCS